MVESPKRKKRWWLWGLLLLIGLGVGGYFWRQHRLKEKPASVQVGKVERRDITESVVATGRIQPVTKVVINPEVAGEIVALPVKEGQAVKEGEVLVKIREDDYRASRDLAEASYQAALANLKLSQANLNKARIDFERTEGLYRDELISKAEFQAGTTALEIAEASFESAGHGVSQAKASLDRAEEELGKTTIVAPIDGTVVQLRSEKGERVVGTSLMAGTEMMTVAQLDQMEARVEVGEVDVVLIKVGQTVRIEADAFRDDNFTGVVSEIANASNTAGLGGAMGQASGQQATKFQVKVRIHEKAEFRPGMSVTSYIETRSVEDVVAVPLQSVTVRAPQAEPGKDEGAGEGKEEEAKVEKVVFLIEGDRVRRQRVEPGISDDEFIEIQSGLEEGQEVITGSYRAINRDLSDGDVVEVTEGAQPSSED